MNYIKKFIVTHLAKADIKPAELPLPLLKPADIEKNLVEKYVKQVYLELGGTVSTAPIITKKWDIELKAGAVVIDDALHFNRYRGITLRSGFYEGIENFPLMAFKRFCRQYENECLKSGKMAENWTSHESEKLFGQPDKWGYITGNGAPQWKLRAYEDFMQDVTGVVKKVKIARISIYDEYRVGSRLITLKAIVVNEEPAGITLFIRNIKKQLGILF